MTASFFDFFPVPQKMRPPRVGIDIGDDAVRIVVLGQHRGGDVVQAYVCKPLPPGAVVSGYIDHDDEVVATLKAAAQEAGCTDAYVTLPEEKMYVFSLDGMSDDTDMRTVVEAHLEDHVPIPPAESVFEVVPVPASTKKTALVTVFPRKTIEAYWNVCTRAGVAVWGFESFPQALAQATTLHTHRCRRRSYPKGIDALRFPHGRP
jgi:Tfp pilus assembly PilM family ATPase